MMRHFVRTIVAAMTVVLLLAACDGSESPANRQPAENSIPDDRAPVIVIGVDGAEWRVIEAMVDNGELPGFRQLMEEGAYGHLLNPGPQVSPVVWTTFATGHFAREHGILDFVYPYQSGAKRPVDASLRKEPAIWNLLDARGGDATVIGYFVSHPAEKIDGTIISDRAFAGLEQSVWPEDLEPLAQQMRESVRRDRDALFSRFFPWDYDSSQAENESSPYHTAARIVRDRIDSRILSEEFLRRMTTELLAEPGDLFITYFRLVDIVSHSAWYYFDASDWREKPDPDNVRLLGQIIPESYRWVDEIIQQILAAHGGSANILVISDHGFGSATGSYESSSELLSGNHRPNGVILAHGPDIEPGPVTEHPTIMEVFPTMANLLGVPIADTIPGSVAFPLLEETFTRNHAPRYVERYELDWQPVATQKVDAGSQQQEMESLRGLGYIGEGVELTDSETDAQLDFWAAEPELVVRTLHADVTYYLLENDVAAANHVTNELKRRQPELLSRLLARVASKIESFRRDVPGGENLAPALEDFLAQHR